MSDDLAIRLAEQGDQPEPLFPCSPPGASLREVFAEYRHDTHLCLCPTCQAVVRAERWVSLPFRGKPATPSTASVRAHWAAISDLLRELAEGRHRRVELADLQVPGRVARPFPHVSISDGLGVGVGIGGDHHRRLLAVAVAERDARTAAFWAGLGPQPVIEPSPPLGQASLFDLEEAS